MGHDDDRSAILRRRRFFIATAVAGLAATQCDKPQPCLNVSVVEDGGTVAPSVCLSPRPVPEDAATPVTPTTPTTPTDAGTDAPPAPPHPRVCLSPVRNPSRDG